MNTRSIEAVLILICLLVAPLTAFAKKGDENFRRGVKFEAAQQWEQAAEEFMLAVAAEPSNTEYQLHCRRAFFNASQMLMEKGRSLADAHDYTGAYNAFRRAAGFDPVNQLAIAEMERMLRLQRQITDPGKPSADRDANVGGPKIISSAYQESSERPVALAGQGEASPRPTERLRVINYNGDLQTLIRSLADELNINVMFDKQSFAQPRNLHVILRDVTAAKALDLIFLQEGLFFQRVDRRTVLIADQSRRPQYQQLVLRTFYLQNASPEDAQKFLQQALPASVGRPQAAVIINKSTNSITVRDTAENVRLIGEIVKGIDKDRAEVVMDVNIYEVSRTDLQQLGAQFGSGDGSVLTLGGTSALGLLAGSREVTTQTSGLNVPTALGAALVLPNVTLNAFQKKDNTRLLYSNQIHAFDGEESTARIGQRVPVQTAQVYGTGTTTSTTSGTATSVYGTNGYPVINYEPTGLTLKFTPQVFSNQDVQVKMSIESKDVTNSSTLTPTFTERTITGTARIQNNRTMMLVSVAQDKQSEGRQGLPVLSGLPIVGRLFSAPRRDIVNSDIVIAVTPRVLRAPTVAPADEEMRPSGTLQAPTSESLEAMLIEVNREDQIALAPYKPDTNLPIHTATPEPLNYAPSVIKSEVIPQTNVTLTPRTGPK
jgi:general secretion pathway protein D